MNPRPSSMYPDCQALLEEAGWVRALALRLARDQAAAEDVAQGTLALALERGPERRQSLRPWLAKVARRLARRQQVSDLRRRFREEAASVERASSSPGSDDYLERLEQQQLLAREVSQLGEPYRRVLVQHYYEGKSPAEIARLQSCSPATVRSQLARGLEKLRARYERSEGGALALFLHIAGPEALSSSLPWSSSLMAMKLSTEHAVAAALVTLALVTGGMLAVGGGPEASLGTPETAPIDALAEVEAPALEDTRPDEETERQVAAAQAEVTTEEPTSPRVEALTTVTARLCSQPNTPLVGGEFASIHADGRPRGDHRTRSGEDGWVALHLPDEDLRSNGARVFPMVFSAIAEDRASVFTLSTPKLHGESHLGDIVLPPGGGARGRVVDEHGSPVPNATILGAAGIFSGNLLRARIVGPSRDIVRPFTRSDDQGQFLISGLPVGEVRLWVHAAGKLWTITEPFDLQAGGLRELGLVTLEPVPAANKVTGQVLRPDGLPRRGAQVAYESMMMGQLGEVSTDAEGRFEIIPSGEGNLRIYAHDPKAAFGFSEVAVARAGDELALRLTDRRQVSLLVLDEERRPLQQAMGRPFVIGDQGEDRPYGLPAQDWKHTDENGALILDLPAQAYVLSVHLNGYEGQSLGPYNPESSPSELTVVLERKARLSGVVLHRGQPVADASISLGRIIPDVVVLEQGFPMRFLSSHTREVRTDQLGVFSLPLDADWTDIALIARHADYATGELQLSVDPGEGRDGLVIELTQGGSIYGKVTPPPGQSLHGQVVAASRGDGHPVSTRSDEDGSYRLDRLAPGDWRVEGRDREPVLEVLAIAQTPEEKELGWNVVVQEGKATEFHIDRRSHGKAELFGNFLIDGQPPTGWTAELGPPEHTIQRDELPVTEIGPDGNFHLEAQAGPYHLVLRGPLGESGRAEVWRAIDIEAPRSNWQEQLATANIEESLPEKVAQARWVRGMTYRGDHEIVLFEAPGDILRAQVPKGAGSLQVPLKTDDRLGWNTLRKVDVP